jgi:hypothetical protein
MSRDLAYRTVTVTVTRSQQLQLGESYCSFLQVLW